jgi:hypothetical protein
VEAKGERLNVVAVEANLTRSGEKVIGRRTKDSDHGDVDGASRLSDEVVRSERSKVGECRRTR